MPYLETVSVRSSACDYCHRLNRLSYRISMKFSVRFRYKNLPSNYEIMKIGSVSHTLHKGVTDVIPISSIFCDWYWWKSVLHI